MRALMRAPSRSRSPRLEDGRQPVGRPDLEGGDAVEFREFATEFLEREIPVVGPLEIREPTRLVEHRGCEQDRDFGTPPSCERDRFVQFRRPRIVGADDGPGCPFVFVTVRWTAPYSGVSAIRSRYTCRSV